MGLLSRFKKRDIQAFVNPPMPPRTTPQDYLTVPGTTLVGDDALAYIGKIAQSAQSRAGVQDAFPTDSFLANALNAQHHFLRDTVAANTTPTISVSANGLPTVETLRADLDAIIAESDLRHFVAELTDVPAVKGFSYEPLDAQAYEQKKKEVGSLRSTFGYRLDNAPDGRLRIAIRETHHVDAPDAASRNVPVLVRDTTGIYEVVFGALLLRGKSDTCTIAKPDGIDSSRSIGSPRTVIDNMPHQRIYKFRLWYHNTFNGKIQGTHLYDTLMNNGKPVEGSMDISERIMLGKNLRHVILTNLNRINAANTTEECGWTVFGCPQQYMLGNSHGTLYNDVRAISETIYFKPELHIQMSEIYATAKKSLKDRDGRVHRQHVQFYTQFFIDRHSEEVHIWYGNDFPADEATRERFGRQLTLENLTYGLRIAKKNTENAGALTV